MKYIIPAAIFLFFMGIMAATEEDEQARKHGEYCQRVEAHKVDPTLGHTDYLGVCK